MINSFSQGTASSAPTEPSSTSSTSSATGGSTLTARRSILFRILLTKSFFSGRGFLLVERRCEGSRRGGHRSGTERTRFPGRWRACKWEGGQESSAGLKVTKTCRSIDLNPASAMWDGARFRDGEAAGGGGEQQGERGREFPAVSASSRCQCLGPQPSIGFTSSTLKRQHVVHLCVIYRSVHCLEPRSSCSV